MRACIGSVPGTWPPANETSFYFIHWRDQTLGLGGALLCISPPKQVKQAKRTKRLATFSHKICNWIMLLSDIVRVVVNFLLLQLRGLFDKSCDSHIRALRILILSSLLWCAASQKQTKLTFKRIVETTLKKIAVVGKGGRWNWQIFHRFFRVFRHFAVKLLKGGNNFKCHPTEMITIMPHNV